MKKIEINPENFRTGGNAPGTFWAFTARLAALALMGAASWALCAYYPRIWGNGVAPQLPDIANGSGILPVLALWTGLACFFPRSAGLNILWFAPAFAGAAQGLLVFSAGLPVPGCVFLGGILCWLLRALLTRRMGLEWLMPLVFGAILFAWPDLATALAAAKYPLFFYLFFFALGVILYNAWARARSWPAHRREAAVCAARLEGLRRFAFSSPKFREILDALMPMVEEYGQRPMGADSFFIMKELRNAVRRAEKALGATPTTMMGGRVTLNGLSTGPDGVEKACHSLGALAFTLAMELARSYDPALDEDITEEYAGEDADEGSFGATHECTSEAENNSDYWGELKK